MLRQYLKEIDKNSLIIKDKQIYKQISPTSGASLDRLIKKQENLEKQVEKCINNLKLAKNRVRFFDDIDGFKTAKIIRKRLQRHNCNTVSDQEKKDVLIGEQVLNQTTSQLRQM